MPDFLLDRITINPNIAHGKPTVRNKRYTVEGMLEYLAGGDTIEDLLREIPDLEKEDLLACLQYAVLSIKHKHAVIKAALGFCRMNNCRHTNRFFLFYLLSKF